MNDSAPKPTRKRRFQKIAAWLLVSVVTFVVLVAIFLAILLNNAQFHQYVLETVQQKASDSLGVRVSVQNYALNLTHLDLDIYGVSVDGAAPYASPALLQVNHAEVGVRIVSLLHANWYLDTFRIDHPVVWVTVDSKGVSNLPTIKSSSDSKSGSGVDEIFDLAIRRAVLDQGELYYNDRKSELAADLHDLDFRASFDPSLQQYSGKVAYSDGHLLSGSFQPLPHDLDAEFDATRSAFHLQHARVSTGPSQILLTATLQNYALPNVDAHYDATVDGAQARQILQNPSIPTGQVRATGALHYHQTADRNVLQSLAVQGDLNSSRLLMKTPSLQTQVANLAAHYALQNGDAKLLDLKLDVMGGQLTGSGTMTGIGSNASHAKLNANLRGVSLAQLRRIAATSDATRNVGLTGSLNAQMNAEWGNTLDDLIAHADATIAGQVGRISPKSVKAGSISTNPGPIAATASGNVPIQSAIHATYTAQSKQLAVMQSYLRTPATNLTLNGTVGNRANRSSLQVKLQADDLREMEAIADIFRTPAPGQPLQPLGLSGTASFNGTVQGSTAAPDVKGQLLASNLHVQGADLKTIRMDVEASPSLISLQHGQIDPASHGHIVFSASSVLNDWTFTNNSPVQIDLDATQLDIAETLQAANQQMPIRGTITANVKLHGTALNPVGNGSVSLTGLVAYDQPITTVKVNFTGTGDEAHASLDVQLPAGRVQSTVSVRPKQRTYTAELTSTGIQLDKLQALKARNINATGEVALHASGAGSFDDPQGEASIQIPQLVVQNQTIKAIKLDLNVANHIANANLSSSAVGTSIQAKARVNITGDYMADATLDTQAIPFQPLLAVYAPEQAASIKGQTEIHATLHGPLKDKNLLEAHVTIPTLQADYNNAVHLAAAAPIHIDYKNGVIDLQRAEIRGTDTELAVQGSIPTVGNAPMSLLAKGTVNLQLAQLFDPDLRTSGELKVDINSYGSVNASSFGGQIEIVDAAFASGDLPVGLQHGNGVLTLTRDRLSISKFQGTVGGGTVTAQGGIALQPKVQFDIGLAAQGIRVLYPQGVREGVDANIRLSGTTEAAVLGGSVDLSDLSFTSAFDLNSFINQFAGGVSTPPTPGFSQNLQLNVALRSSNNINLVSRTLSVDGSANLQLRGTAANPVILGRVNLNDGDIILNGDRFLLQGGTIEFVNPSETEPVLNVSLKTTIQQYDVYMRFNGPIDQLRTNYNSDPALPSADIINLLAFGKTTEASAQDNTPTNQAAASLVASQVSSQVTSRVSKIAGISQLSINPVLSGSTNQGPAGANITIQQRVTGNLFVTFTSNVASTQSQTIQGQYQVSPRVALSVTRDQSGGFAFDTLIKKTW